MSSGKSTREKTDQWTEGGKSQVWLRVFIPRQKINIYHSHIYLALTHKCIFILALFLPSYYHRILTTYFYSHIKCHGKHISTYNILYYTIKISSVNISCVFTSIVYVKNLKLILNLKEINFSLNMLFLNF